MKRNKAGIAALMLAVLFLVLTIPICADGDALTPEGNMSLTDDFTSADGDKQFITVKTADGDYYYIIIDRAGITENVYFLKMVGNSDLPADAENTPISPAEQTCTCRDKCTSGHIDTSCTVCVMDSSKCSGKESVSVPSQQTPQQPATTGNSVPMIGVILLIAMGGAALYFVIKGKKDKGSGRGKPVTGNRRDDPEDDEDDGDFGAFHPDDDDEEDD